MAGQGLQRLEGYPGLFQGREHLAALGIEIEDFTIGVHIGQEVALLALLAFFGVLPGFVDPFRRASFRSARTIFAAFVLPRLAQRRSPAGLPARYSRKKPGQVLADRLNILPTMLAVAGLHHDARFVAVEVERFGCQAGQLLIPQARVADHKVEHEPIGTGEAATLRAPQPLPGGGRTHPVQVHAVAGVPRLRHSEGTNAQEDSGRCDGPSPST